MTPRNGLHHHATRAPATRSVRALHERLRSLHPTRRSGRSGETGAVMVEFALILPLVLILFLLIIDFGRAMNYWIDETHLASEGARFAAVDRTPDGSDVRAYL